MTKTRIEEIKGKKIIKEKKGIDYFWVTRFVTRKQWDELYSQNISYAFIESVRGGYRIGFLLPKLEIVEGKFPVDIKEATEYDIKEIKKWRVRNNIYPR